MQGQDNTIPGYDGYVPNFMSNYEGDNFHNASGYENGDNTFNSLAAYGNHTLNSTSGYGSDVGAYMPPVYGDNTMNQMPNYENMSGYVNPRKRSLDVVPSYQTTSGFDGNGQSFSDQMEPLPKKKRHSYNDQTMAAYQYPGYCQNTYQMPQFDANQPYQWPQQAYNYCPMPPSYPSAMYQQPYNTIILNPALPIPKIPDNEVIIATIPGRLSVHGNYKHDVTLAEIKRRIAAPEMLNQSLIAAYIRKAKSKESGEWVVTKLAAHGVSLSLGRRKTVKVTTLTSLIEAEAFQIVVDHKKDAQKYFDAKSVAYELMRMTQTVEEFEQRKHYFWNAYATFEQLIQFISIDLTLQWIRVPIIQESDRNQLINTIGTLHPATQETTTKFAMLSHCFGTAFHLHAWAILSAMCKEIYQAFADPEAFLDEIQLEPPQIVTLMMYGMNFDRRLALLGLLKGFDGKVVLVLY
uniref:TF_AP-2 domain-containing protein n=1 Tax=Panagrellus redivivus TaxID=6233 RepID=A0A7E4UU36_PANRE